MYSENQLSKTENKNKNNNKKKKVLKSWSEIIGASQRKKTQTNVEKVKKQQNKLLLLMSLFPKQQLNQEAKIS